MRPQIPCWHLLPTAALLVLVSGCASQTRVVPEIYSLESLSSDLEDASDSPGLESAVSQVQRLGIEHRDLLESLLRHPDADVAKAAAKALVSLGDERSFAAIRAALSESDPESEAARSLVIVLGLSGDKASIPFIEALAAIPKWEDVSGVLRAMARHMKCPGEIDPLVRVADDHFELAFLSDDISSIEYECSEPAMSVSLPESDYAKVLGYILAAHPRDVTGSPWGGDRLTLRLRSGRCAIFCEESELFCNCQQRFEDGWSGIAMESRELIAYLESLGRESSN